MAHRVEGQIASDWSFEPMMRNIFYRYEAAHAELLKTRRLSLADEPAESRATKYIQAAAALYERLRHGTYGEGKKKRRIAGDFTKLLYCKDLTPEKRDLIAHVKHVAKTLPGAQQIREMMGQYLFGARVVYGDILFLTVSPSEKHSGLVLRLSKCRQNDFMLEADGSMKDVRRGISGRDAPSLSANSTMEIDLPAYPARRKMNARDPHAVVCGFRVCMYVLLPRCLGHRMCPMCPRCNVDGSLTPCQDQFGSNARPMGGAVGLSQAAGLAVEF